MQAPGFPLALGACLGLFGCTDLARFDNEPGESYCGAMLSAPVFHEGFLPEGLPPSLRLRLVLHNAVGGARPGHITTDDADRGLCSDGDQPLFSVAPLRTMTELEHDLLSTMSFGEGIEHNILAWVDSTCQGTMFSVVSLLRDDSVQVRLLKPAPLPPPDAGPERRPGFALFHLERKPDDCGF